MSRICTATKKTPWSYRQTRGQSMASTVDGDTSMQVSEDIITTKEAIYTTIDFEAKYIHTTFEATFYIFRSYWIWDFFNQWSHLEVLVYPEENRCINEVRKYLTTKNQLEGIHTCSGTFHTKGNLKTLTLQHHPVSFSFKRFHMGSVFPLEKTILSLAKKSFQALTS